MNGLFPELSEKKEKKIYSFTIILHLVRALRTPNCTL